MIVKGTCKSCGKASIDVIKSLEICCDCIAKAMKRATPSTARALKMLLNAQYGETGTNESMPVPFALFTDGGARGNPGHAGIGIVVVSSNRVITRKGKYIGKTTNNVAEYTALIEGLQHVIGMDRPVACFSDSELMVKQLNGEYKVRNARLKELHAEVMRLVEGDRIRFTHVPRENEWIAEADKMVNLAIDDHLKNGEN